MHVVVFPCGSCQQIYKVLANPNFAASDVPLIELDGARQVGYVAAVLAGNDIVASHIRAGLFADIDGIGNGKGSSLRGIRFKPHLPLEVLFGQELDAVGADPAVRVLGGKRAVEDLQLGIFRDHPVVFTPKGDLFSLYTAAECHGTTFGRGLEGVFDQIADNPAKEPLIAVEFRLASSWYDDDLSFPPQPGVAVDEHDRFEKQSRMEGLGFHREFVVLRGKKLPLTANLGHEHARRLGKVVLGLVQCHDSLD